MPGEALARMIAAHFPTEDRRRRYRSLPSETVDSVRPLRVASPAAAHGSGADSRPQTSRRTSRSRFQSGYGAEWRAPAKRLEEYARYPLFRTVGIDSAFYDPPSEEELHAYAGALPPGFPCVSKVWDRITAKRLSQDAGQPGLAGMRNPDFLNAALFKDAVLGPYTRAFRDHTGCFVFEFQSMRG